MNNNRNKAVIIRSHEDRHVLLSITQIVPAAMDPYKDLEPL